MKKVHILPSHIKIHPHICLELFWNAFACKRCLICVYFSPDSDETTFSLKKAILWIEDSHFSWKQWIEVKNVLMMNLFNKIYIFLLHKTLLDGSEWCGLLVDYCGVFISCLDTYSDGTHSLQRIRCWVSDVMLNFTKSVRFIKQTNLYLQWPECE